MRITVILSLFVTSFCVQGFGCDQQLVDPQDPLLYEQSYLNFINAPLLWKVIADRNFCNSSLVGLVLIDTGANLSHPDLFGHIDTIWSHDFTDDSNPYLDPVPHGTAMIGEMTAVRNNGIGIAGMTNQNVIVFKVCTADPNVAFGTSPYTCKIEWIRAAIEALKMLPYQKLVVNLSFTIGPDEAVHNAMADLTNRAVFVSAPYNGDGGGGDYPCADPLQNNICGGSVSANQGHSSFKYGGGVSILGPGENILTTYGNDVYKLVTGSSAVAPLISSTAFLLFTQHLESSPAEIVRALKIKSVNPTLLVDDLPTLDTLRSLEALEAKDGEPVEKMTCVNGVSGEWYLGSEFMVTCTPADGRSFTDQYCVADFDHVPTELCGVRMLLDGTPLPMYYAKPDSVTAQIPKSTFLFPHSRHTLQIGDRYWTFVVQYPAGWQFTF